MKKLVAFATLVFTITTANSQSVAINEDGSAADGSAILDVKATGKGILCPRMTEADRAAIVNPAKGLLVYQTDGMEGYYYNGGTDVTPSWTRVANERTPVAFSVNTSSSLPITNTYTKVPFNTEEYDESGNFTPASFDFTAPSPGIYHFSTTVAFQGPTNNRYDIAFFVNGVQKKTVLTILAIGYTTLSLSSDLKLSANDKVDVRIVGPSGGQVLDSSQLWNYFSGHKIQ